MATKRVWESLENSFFKSYTDNIASAKLLGKAECLTSIATYPCENVRRLSSLSSPFEKQTLFFEDSEMRRQKSRKSILVFFDQLHTKCA